MVVIVSGVHIAIGSHGSSLARTRLDDLAALVVGETVRRAGIIPDLVDELIPGAANQAGKGSRNVARLTALLAGLPQKIPGFTVNRLRASEMTAIAAGDDVTGGGDELMTRAPWVQDKPARVPGKLGTTCDASVRWRFSNPRFDGPTTLSMPEMPEEVARRWSPTRRQYGEFALRSHQNTIEAIDSGDFDSEIVPVPVKGGEVAQNEGPRATPFLDTLAALQVLFGHLGVVVAGNSSCLNDGAAAPAVVSERFLTTHALPPRARIVASANLGVEPAVLGIGPAPATQKALTRDGWSTDSLEALELNEAFAAQSLACIKELGLTTSIVNADRGAIALGDRAQTSLRTVGNSRSRRPSFPYDPILIESRLHESSQQRRRDRWRKNGCRNCLCVLDTRRRRGAGRDWC